MSPKYMEAIETANWVLHQTQPKDLDRLPSHVLKELNSLKSRVNWLFNYNKNLPRPQIKK